MGMHRMNLMMALTNLAKLFVPTEKTLQMFTATDDASTQIELGRSGLPL